MNRREAMKLGFAGLTALGIPLEPEPWRLWCVAMVADVPNKNGRIYPTSLLEKEVERLAPSIANRSFVGTIGYPSDVVALKDVSHVITHLSLNRCPTTGNNLLWARAEPLDTFAGRRLISMLGNDITLRPMGIGELTASDNVIGDGYRMTSICVIPTMIAA